MKLAAPFIQLPLLFDADALAAEIEALGEQSWMPHPQGFPGNSMLPLIAVGGDPANESFGGVMHPTPHLQRCPYLSQVMASLGVTLGRSRLMRLSGGAEVKRHADQGYYWADRVRVHVPVVTQPTVRFECGDSHVNMAAGECWIFDTWRQHRVLNDDHRSRIHLVVDTVGGDRFWSLVGAGRNQDGVALGGRWEPRQVGPDAAARPELVCESANVPVVMTPWEITHRIRFLLGEAVPHPALGAVQQLAARFCRDWLALWAAHGERAEGWPAYRRALEAFMRELAPLSGQLVLQNELGFHSALTTLVAKVAVSGDGPRPSEEGMVAAAPAPAATVPAGPRSVQAEGTPPAPAVDPVFDRPVFVVSSPRSGSTMLFEALAQAPGVYTIGGESHALIETIPELSPALNGLDSNRLTGDSATPQVVQALRTRFQSALVDREGRPPPPGTRPRMLEKTPKNALRVPFLAAAFPEAVFVYLYREPRETLGSMIDAWNSGRFRTYPNLPGWTGQAWSLLLTPGWRELAGEPLGEVVARQWETTTRLLLDDLAALPAGRVHTVRYDALVADPGREVARLCGALGFAWDRPVEQAFPLSRYTLSAPAPDKWKRHAAEIEPRLPRLQATMDRAARFAA